MAKKLNNNAGPASGQWMTVAEYAKHRGISHGSVVGALRNKTISYANANERLIDQPAADALMDAALARSGRLTPKGGSGDVEDATVRLTIAKADREEGMAELAQLKAAQMRGELIAVADLQPVLFGLARVLRERLMASAQRLGPVLAAEPRAVRCTLAIEREIGAALTEFADTIPTALATIAGTEDAADDAP